MDSKKNMEWNMIETFFISSNSPNSMTGIWINNNNDSHQHQCYYNNNTAAGFSLIRPLIPCYRPYWVVIWCLPMSSNRSCSTKDFVIRWKKSAAVSVFFFSFLRCDSRRRKACNDDYAKIDRLILIDLINYLRQCFFLMHTINVENNIFWSEVKVFCFVLSFSPIKWLSLNYFPQTTTRHQHIGHVVSIVIDDVLDQNIFQSVPRIKATPS